MEPEGSGPSYLYHDGVRTRNFLTFVNAVTLLHTTQDPGVPADALPAYNGSCVCKRQNATSTMLPNARVREAQHQQYS